MSLDRNELGLLRSGWRRFREPLHLTDPQDPEFGTGGLAQQADVPVRLLILPADPDANLIEFDEDFWKWWMEDRVDPITNEPSHWGPDNYPTSAAAVRIDGRNEKGWHRHLGLYRHGGMEMGLGREATYNLSELKCFRLITIVGRLWCALSHYSAVLSRYPKLPGPWEVSLAILKTKGSALGNLGQDWLEPHEGNGKQCQEPALFHRRELMEWPDQDATKNLAFKLGQWIGSPLVWLTP